MLSSFAQNYGLITGQAFRAGAHHGYVDLGHQQLPVQLRQMLKRDRDFFCVADNLVSPPSTRSAPTACSTSSSSSTSRSPPPGR